MEEAKVPSTFKKAVNGLLNAGITFFSAVLFVLLFINFQTMFLEKAYNNVFGYSFFEITTGSMAPAIEIGDWIIVRIDNEHIELDDVITYQEGNAFVTHRVTQISGDIIQTKGDANNANDTSIVRSQVIGKEVMILHRFGIIKKLFLNPKLLIMFIVIMVVLCSILDGSFDERVFASLKSKTDEKKEQLKEAINHKKNELKEENERLERERQALIEKKEALKKEIEEEEAKKQILTTYKLEETPSSEFDKTELLNLRRNDKPQEEPLSKTTLLSNLTVEVKNHRVLNLDENKTKK